MNEVDAVRQLVRARKKFQSRREIARAAGVNYHWLEKFTQGVHKAPRVDQFLKLKRYLLRPRPGTLSP